MISPLSPEREAEIRARAEAGWLPNADESRVLLAALDHERAEKARILAAHHAQSRAVEETLGRALGFVEDPEYGLATGDHTPVTLADEIAGRLEKVRALADDTGAWSAGDARPGLVLAMLRGDL